MGFEMAAFKKSGSFTSANNDNPLFNDSGSEDEARPARSRSLSTSSVTAVKGGVRRSYLSGESVLMLLPRALCVAADGIAVVGALEMTSYRLRFLRDGRDGEPAPPAPAARAARRMRPWARHRPTRTALM